MRTAAENTTGNTVYAELLNNCRHSRLQAAMAAHQPRLQAPRALTPPVAAAAVAEPGFSGTAKAYITVAGMSVLSMLSVVLSGAINA